MVFARTIQAAVCVRFCYCYCPSVDNWWAVNAKYYGGSFVNNVPTGGYVTSSLSVGQEYTVPAAASTTWGITYSTKYSMLTLAGVNGVSNMVTKVIQTAGWTPDPNAVYVVYTDPTVKQVHRPSTPCVPFPYSLVRTGLPLAPLVDHDPGHAVNSYQLVS